MNVLRSMLFVPGSNARRVEKALGLDAGVGIAGNNADLVARDPFRCDPGDGRLGIGFVVKEGRDILVAAQCHSVRHRSLLGSVRFRQG